MGNSLTAKIIGVEQAQGGVVIILVQEKMKIPIAEEIQSDELMVAKKMKHALRVVGLNLEMPTCMDGSFRTGLWFPMEEYEALGKPTIGDVLHLAIKVEK